MVATVQLEQVVVQAGQRVVVVEPVHVDRLREVEALCAVPAFRVTLARFAFKVQLVGRAKV